MLLTSMRHFLTAPQVKATWVCCIFGPWRDLPLVLGILFFVTFSAKLRLSRHYPVVACGGGNRPKPPLNLKSQATFTCPGCDSNPDSGERQLAVSGNALDHTAIRAGPSASFIEVSEVPRITRINAAAIP